jgi:hypothetical protein
LVVLIPDERHEREQYFFRQGSAAALCYALAEFESPCVLCAPLVGAELSRRRRGVRVLDIDTRFGVVFCDPPFFTVSLSQLFKAVRMLAGHDTATPVAITYLSRRAGALTATFAPFDLRPTGYRPEYLTVQNDGRNAIEVFANFDCPLWTRSADAPTMEDDT